MTMTMIWFLDSFKYPNISCGCTILFLYFDWQNLHSCFLLLSCTWKSEFFHELSPVCKSCSSVFNSKWVLTHPNSQTKGICLYKLILGNIAFRFYVLFYFFSMALHTKCPSIYRWIVYIFSIAFHVVRNLFWKICPLFGQILVKCLKCSRTSFSPSSYSKKMSWERRCKHSLMS